VVTETVLVEAQGQSRRSASGSSGFSRTGPPDYGLSKRAIVVLMIRDGCSQAFSPRVCWWWLARDCVLAGCHEIYRITM
jgi:hypothetical protein